MLVLISGVVLLTHKKAERTPPSTSFRRTGRKPRSQLDGKVAEGDSDDEHEAHALRTRRGGEGEEGRAPMWDIGEASDEDEDQDLESSAHPNGHVSPS
jgi:hypothetical protein